MTRNTVVSNYNHNAVKTKDTTEQRLKDHILLLETIADCERCITKFREMYHQVS
jgi:hypothetical protein